VLVSASEDRSIRLWDVGAGTEIASFIADSALATCTVASDPPIVIAGDQFGRTYFLKIEGLADNVAAKKPMSSVARKLRMESELKRRGKFDVFLCHNSVDKPAIRLINEKLKSFQIQTWLDEEQIRPGTDWLDILEKQIFAIRSAAVFVGEEGTGPWQRLEIKALLRKFVRKSSVVIPVILANCKREPEIPSFLEGFHRVDFRSASPDPLEQLVWGITGKRRLE
jgi:hypothetical protein